MKKFLLITLLLVFILSSCSLVDSNLFSSDSARKPDSEKNNGNAYGLGNGNAFGLGNGNGNSFAFGATYQNEPTSAADPIQLAGGYEHSAVILSDGSLWTVGDNSFGQLGNGSLIDEANPIHLMDNAIQVGCGPQHSAVLKDDGTVWTFGRNDYGQLGDGTFIDKSTPVQVMGIDNVKQIEPSFMHTFFLKQDGSVWVVGNNVNDNMQVGTFEHITSPAYLEHFGVVDQLSMGQGFVLLLMDDGTVYGAGNNWNGELGIGNQSYIVLDPTQMLGMESAKQVAAGEKHSVILKTDGTVWVTGSNYYGQLGIGAISDTICEPIQVLSIPEIIKISCGYSHTLLLDIDGNVWAMGNNEYGQLGFVGDLRVYYPEKIESLTGVSDIIGGAYHTLFLMNDGTILTSGLNSAGQLGDGSIINKSEPVEMVFTM
jgi:alpha-tubulin suppressor-like RCC1 family protein